MLAHQLRTWASYPEHVQRHFRFVVVDDCSRTLSAYETMMNYGGTLPVGLMLYEVLDDRDWNQHGARNLAAREAATAWLLMLDIDHVLTAENATRLVDEVSAWRTVPVSRRWFKFPRERIGAADETRTKDATHRHIDPTISRVPVNPAMNCFLTSRAAYWAAGGYNEDFCGCYGGDSQFLRELRLVAGEPVELSDVWLQVHTRHSVPDANTVGLDRSPEPMRERLADMRGQSLRGHDPVRFKWRRVL